MKPGVLIDQTFHPLLQRGGFLTSAFKFSVTATGAGIVCLKERCQLIAIQQVLAPFLWLRRGTWSFSAVSRSELSAKASNHAF
jgi:hypothetical protein